MRKRSIIILAIVILIAIAGFIIYIKVKEKTDDVVNKTPDFSINATNLIAAFEKDSASATKMYIDKIVEVTGNVKSIDTSGAVILGEEGNPSEVVIGLDRRHAKDYEKLKVGRIALMQGTCSGYNKSSSNDPNDLLADLGSTVQLRSGGVKNKN